MKSKTVTFSRIFFPLLLAVVIAGVIGFVLYFSNNLTTDLSTFYVQYGSTEIRHDSKGLSLKTGVYHSFDCKYVLGFPTAEKGEHYTVKIIPNDTKENIEYKVDGYRTSFYPNKELDVSGAFQLIKHTDSFILLIPNDITLQSILNSAYDGKTVTDVPQVDLTTKDYFQLVVSSYNGTTQILIDFSIQGG